MYEVERRRYRRLEVRLDLSCRKAAALARKLYTGYTVNVSPGGLYFETTAGDFTLGDLLKIELSIPPTAGLLESGGRISGFAKVLRTSAIYGSEGERALSSARYGIALEFCRSPKLRV